MTTVGDWTLLIEPISYLGVTERRVPASTGTRWVSHLRQHQRRQYISLGQGHGQRLTFEPGSPDYRWATTPDELLDAMHHIGFQFGG